MRCLLLFLAFTFASSVFSQTRVDTIYNRWGELNQIRFSSQLDVSGMSKSDRFMRGVTEGRIVLQLDSIRLYTEDGGSKVLKGDAM